MNGESIRITRKSIMNISFQCDHEAGREWAGELISFMSAAISFVFYE